MCGADVLPTRITNVKFCVIDRDTLARYNPGKTREHVSQVKTLHRTANLKLEVNHELSHSSLELENKNEINDLRLELTSDFRFLAQYKYYMSTQKKKCFATSYGFGTPFKFLVSKRMNY